VIWFSASTRPSFSVVPPVPGTQQNTPLVVRRASPALSLGALAVLIAVPLGPGAAAPASAQGSCGGVQTATPRHRGHARPPLAIGDSTMLLALPALAGEGFEVNAHGCREYGEALDLLARRARARTLPHLVVVALGADGTVTAEDVLRTLALVGPDRVLVLVTPRELGGGSGADAQEVRRAGATHSGQVGVLDWVAHAAAHPDWFQPDGLHLTDTGAAAFATFLARALPLARPLGDGQHLLGPP
jgi:hypothetical protein